MLRVLYYRWVQHQHDSGHCIKPSVSLPSLVKKTLRYLNISTWGTNSFLTYKPILLCPFQVDNPSLRLGDANSHHATSHSAPNCLSANRKLRLGEVNRSTSSAKSREQILTTPNLTPSTPWQWLETLFMAKGNPGRMQHPPGSSVSHF